MNEVKYGVYINPKNGNLKYFCLGKHETKGFDIWELHEGRRCKHPLFRITVEVFKSMSIGWPVYEYGCDLKGYEYLGDL
jgi:hypothetical protein